MLEFKDAKGKTFTRSQKKYYYRQIMEYKAKFKASKGFKGFNNYPASHYKGKFYLPTPESLEALYALRVQEAMRDVKKIVGEGPYYNLHPEAQSELLQMYYRLGNGKFKDFGELVKAAQVADYATMAKHSHIKGQEKDEKGNLTAFELRNIATRDAIASCNGRKWLKYGNIIVQQEKQIAQQVRSIVEGKHL